MQRQTMRRLYDVGSFIEFDHLIRRCFFLRKMVRFSKSSAVNNATKATFGAVCGGMCAFFKGTAEHKILRRNMVCRAKCFRRGV